MGTFSRRFFWGCLFNNKEKLSVVKTHFTNVNILTKFIHQHRVNYLKSDLPIKWFRPEKIPCYKPEKSGDLKPLEQVDAKLLAPEFRDLEELKRY